jgi:hypothetical protein
LDITSSTVELVVNIFSTGELSVPPLFPAGISVFGFIGSSFLIISSSSEHDAHRRIAGNKKTLIFISKN